MSGEEAQFLAQATVWKLMILSLPILGLTTVVSLVISIVQAVTQIQDQALPFTLKFAVVMVVLTFFGAWMMAELSTFFVDAVMLLE